MKWRVALYFMTCIVCAAVADNGGSTGSASMQEQEIQAIYEHCWYLLSQIHVDTSGLDEAIDLYYQVLEAAPRDKDIYW